MASAIDLINLSNDTHTNFKKELPEYLSPGWTIYKSEEVSSLIGVQIYKNDITKEVVIGIQGSNQLKDWSHINTAFSLGTYPNAVKELVEYVNNNVNNNKEFKENGYSVQVTGFSQGGGLAELLSNTYGWGGNGQNSPGAGKIINNSEYLQQLKELGIEAKGVPDSFVTLVESGDVVDTFGNHLSEVISLDITGNSTLGSLSLLAFSNPLIKIAALLYLGYDTYTQHDIEKLNNYVNTLSKEDKELFNAIVKAKADKENNNDNNEEKSVVFIDHYENTKYYKAKSLLIEFNNGKDISLGELFQELSSSKLMMKELKDILKQKGNYDLANYIDSDGNFKIRITEDIGKKIVLETQEGNALSTQLGTSIGGSIGSVIIGNNDFSNIEKIAISTSTTVVGQNVGEYIFWDSKNGNGSGAFDDIGADFKNTLQGVICY